MFFADLTYLFLLYALKAEHFWNSLPVYVFEIKILVKIVPFLSVAKSMV